MKATSKGAFTVQEVLHMQEMGTISDGERFELIEGAIVPMHARPHEHELIKSALSMGFARRLPEGLWLGVATTIYLSDDTFVEPDLVIYPRGIKLEEVKGADIVLAIEVAVTSFAYDSGFKAQLYARHRVFEFWVVDAAERCAYVHTAPSANGWEKVIEYGPQENLVCAAIPGFSMRLGTI